MKPHTSLRQLAAFERGGDPTIFLSPRTCIEESVRTVTPGISLCSVLRQRVVFEGGAEPTIFLSPRARIEKSVDIPHLASPTGCI